MGRGSLKTQVESLTSGFLAVEADPGSRSEVLRQQLETARQAIDPTA